MKPVAYIVGPYRAETVVKTSDNIHAAAKVAQEYWAAGYTVICPHMNSAHFSGCCPEEYFLESYKDLLTCGLVDLVVALPGWFNSEGSKAEIRLARGQSYIEIKLLT